MRNLDIATEYILEFTTKIEMDGTPYGIEPYHGIPCALIMLVIALTSLIANSQYVFKKETHLGIKAGGTLSMVSFDPKVDQN